jgi:putative transposase
VPRKQSKRRRLRLDNGSCVRLRAEYPNHVWSHDFVTHRTHDKQVLKLLTLIEGVTQECLVIKVAWRPKSQDVMEQLADLLLSRGLPGNVRSNDGPEFIARKIK